jgi:O-antigen biosynthesis protein
MFVSSPFVNNPFVSPFNNTPFVTPAQPPPQPEQPRELSLPRVVNYLADYSGCGHWRIIWPEQILNANQQMVSQSNTCMVFDPRWYENVKAVKIQRQATSEQKKFIEYLKSIQKQHNFKLIYEVDDVVFKECIPDYNRFKFAFDTNEIRQNCIDIINMVDEVTVTCDYMRDLYREKTGKQEITVIPNFPPFFWMGYLFNHSRICNNLDKHYKKPRILYTGSGAHYDVENKTGGKDDFEHVVKAIIDTRHKYQWVFMGAFPPPLLPYVKSGEIEFHPWQHLYAYPKKIYDLNINLMIAPLQDNPFNRAKSDIKYIEACILGIPVICQDICTYKDAMLKFNSGEELLDKIAATLKNKPKYRMMSTEMREIGETRFLESAENVGCVYESYTTPYNSPERKYLKKWN